MRNEAIKTLVPQEVYTDRQEFLDYFYEYALKGITRRSMSTVLLGQRRMGKTEIFKRVVNRLFYEQDHTDPTALVPVYYSFPEIPPDRWEFSLRYVENFLRWYAAFRLRDPLILTEEKLPLTDLATFIRQEMPLLTERMEIAVNAIDVIQRKDVTTPEQLALWLPRRVSDWDDTTIVVFLDEFQNVQLPHYNFQLVGYMQEAVESPTCPHFVTGSAISILSREIIGRGSLFGRFRASPVEGLTNYYGAELAQRAANHYGADLPTLMAPILAERCGGNPFYITAVVQQAAEQKQSLRTEDDLSEVLAIDITSGFIWGELSDQVNRWIARINEHNITKWILYLSALETEERINLERIQHALREKEFRDVPLETIREVLVKLSRGDLVEYLELGGWFRKVKDPILLEFLRVWGRIEVEGTPYSRAHSELLSRYQKLKRQINEYKGYLTEVFMSQVLWAGQNKTLPGDFFNHPTDIKMPRQFIFVRQRMRLGDGVGQEIDLIGAAGADMWVGQSKWWTTKKADVSVLTHLLQQGEAARVDYKAVRATCWLFAYSGLTAEAETFAAEHGLLWSTHEQLNRLLKHVGLRQLPDIDADD